ncbi:uncharacterized protein LOC134266523 [Saccostrea cucullata]|uniref:uncharacterized protein LOC134266523 n=1 Tax=Saccostrea cuccullata TaxID=36930 RepID=UPI002ED43CCD
MDTTSTKATTETHTKGSTWNQNQEKIHVKGEKEIQEELEENSVKQGELNNKSGTGKQGHVDDLSLHRGSDFCNQTMEGQEDIKDKTDFGDLDCGSDFCVPALQEESEELNCGSDFRLWLA